ncbi:MAG: hypothetical protein AABX63_00825 [Nanoarchaeota archaeon]
MAKKKQKHGKGKEKLTQEKGKVGEYLIETSQTVSDIKTFIDNFKSDVEKKKKDYQSYAKNFAKKKFKK